MNFNCILKIHFKNEIGKRIYVPTFDTLFHFHQFSVKHNVTLSVCVCVYGKIKMFIENDFFI